MEFKESEEIEIKDWEHFNKLAAQFTAINAKDDNTFRGQSQDWPLLSSLARIIKDKVDLQTGLNIEQETIEQFKHKLPIYTDYYKYPAWEDPINILAFMQHHHAPTRLLDWSESPYIALYFAVKDHSDKNGVLYHFRRNLEYTRLIRGDGQTENTFVPKCFAEIRKSVRGEKYIKCYIGIGSTCPTDRMVAQKSIYSLTTELLEPHNVTIDRFFQIETEKRSVFKKYIIKKELKEEFLYNLMTMNITAAALFPGVDGLGKSIAENVKILSMQLPKDE